MNQLKQTHQQMIQSNSKDTNIPIVEIVGKCDKCGDDIRKLTYPNGDTSFMCLGCIAKEEEQKAIAYVNSKEGLVSYNKKNCGFSKRDVDAVNEPYITDDGNIDAYNMAMKYANRFNEDTSIGFYIYGSVGVGKSLLAKKIMKIVLYRGYSAYITNIIQLMNDIKNDLNNFSDTTLRKCQNVDLLVIDDVGTEKNTDFENSRMFLITDYRYENKKPTIFTSNLKLDELTTKYDEFGRIYSRIRGATQVLEIKGKDRRI